VTTDLYIPMTGHRARKFLGLDAAIRSARTIGHQRVPEIAAG
jgi:hypothetical protein